MQGRTSHWAQAGSALTRALGICAVCVPAIGLGEPLRLDTASTIVEYREHDKANWQPIEPDARVKLPGEIRIEQGHAVLRQGRSTYALKQATHLAFTPASDDPEGAIGTINHHRGTVYYTIENEPAQLRVETPFLVAEVTGTEFVIVSTDAASYVTLTKGELEVADLGTGETQTLAPGMVASSASGAGGMRAFNTATAPPQDEPGSDSELIPLPPGSDAPTGAGFEAALDGVDDIAVEQQGAEEVALEEQDDGGFAEDPILDDQDGADGPALDDDLPGNDSPVEDDIPANDDPVEDDIPGGGDDPVEDDIPGGGDDPVEDDIPGGGDDPIEDDIPDDDPVEDDIPGAGDDPIEDDIPGSDLPGDDDPVEDDGPGSGDDDPVEDDGPGSGDDDMPDGEDKGDDDEDCILIVCHDHPGGGKDDDDKDDKGGKDGKGGKGD